MEITNLDKQHEKLISRLQLLEKINVPDNFEQVVLSKINSSDSGGKRNFGLNYLNMSQLIPFSAVAVIILITTIFLISEYAKLVDPTSNMLKPAEHSSTQSKPDDIGNQPSKKVDVGNGQDNLNYNTNETRSKAPVLSNAEMKRSINAKQTSLTKSGEKKIDTLKKKMQLMHGNSEE